MWVAALGAPHYTTKHRINALELFVRHRIFSWGHRDIKGRNAAALSFERDKGEIAEWVTSKAHYLTKSIAVLGETLENLSRYTRNLKAIYGKDTIVNFRLKLLGDTAAGAISFFGSLISINEERVRQRCAIIDYYLRRYPTVEVNTVVLDHLVRYWPLSIVQDLMKHIVAHHATASGTTPPSRIPLKAEIIASEYRALFLQLYEKEEPEGVTTWTPDFSTPTQKIARIANGFVQLSPPSKDQENRHYSTGLARTISNRTTAVVSHADARALGSITKLSAMLRYVHKLGKGIVMLENLYAVDTDLREAMIKVLLNKAEMLLIICITHSHKPLVDESYRALVHRRHEAALRHHLDNALHTSDLASLTSSEEGGSESKAPAPTMVEGDSEEDDVTAALLARGLDVAEGLRRRRDGHRTPPRQETTSYPRSPVASYIFDDTPERRSSRRSLEQQRRKLALEKDA